MILLLMELSHFLGLPLDFFHNNEKVMIKYWYFIEKNEFIMNELTSFH